MSQDPSDVITAFFDEHVGEAGAHYAAYPGPDLFVHRIHPTDARPWSTLYTVGASRRMLPDMDPDNPDDDPWIEIVVCTPPGWFHDESGDGGPGAPADRGEWVVELLQWMAALPWTIDHPLYAGALVPNGEPVEPYADGGRFCGLLIGPVLTLGPDTQYIDMPDGRRVRLLSLVLLDEREIAFGVDHGVEALFEKLDAHGIFEKVDPDRPCALDPAPPTA